ncbi:unnamed protein product [Gongylonema pulchrum]|uniref:VWFC domain-containing protein n=1 Tax=Gongylonema pulchrum TaxID=637853 RepID=A0A3P7NZX1_9BILA|nr:unnamed protein product [Gongylonema pulchrum]
MITSWRVQCVSKCLWGRFLTGFCCKLCTTPAEVPDRCVRCDLVLNQWYHCYRFTCPVLNCPISQHVKNPERCCPECKTHKVIAGSMNLTALRRLQCKFRGIHYQVHDTFRVDPCTRCSCQHGGIICRRFSWKLHIIITRSLNFTFYHIYFATWFYQYINFSFLLCFELPSTTLQHGLLPSACVSCKE